MKRRFLLYFTLFFLLAMMVPNQVFASSLSAPDDLSASADSSSQISLSWDAVEDVTSYYIFRSTSSSGTYTRIAIETDTSYTDDDLLADTKYYYKVQAHNSSSTSSYSNSVYATTEEPNGVPDTPEDLSATATSSSQIKLSWDPVDDAESYYIYRASPTSSEYSKIASSVKDTTYADTGLSAGTTYRYKIRAHNSEGYSDYSERASAQTLSSSTSNSSGSSSSSNSSTTTITTSRIAGSDRYLTSAEIAKQGWSTSSYAVIVSGENYPDALCGTPLAAKYNAPVLLTSKYKLEDSTKTQLTRMNVKNVFIIGGTNVIAANVELALKNMGITITRVYGADRYETSLKIAKLMGSFSEVFVTTGESFPDALSVASIAGIKRIPIILTSKSSIPQATVQYLSNNVSGTYVIGDTSVISAGVVEQLPSPIRLNGSSRTGSNIAILKEFSSEFTSKACYLVTGEAYPDALTGSALAALKKSPVILAYSSALSSIKEFNGNFGSTSLIALGGTSALPASTLNTLGTSSSSSLSAPTSLKATADSSNSIALSWSEVSGATGYYVYRSSSSDGTYTQVKTVSGTSCTDSSLSSSTMYYYKIKAYSGSATSGYSSNASARTYSSADIDAPDDLEATSEDEYEIYLTWDAVDDADSYYVYRATSENGTFSKIDTVNDTEYYDEDLREDWTYYYKVKAHGDEGTSDFSAVASASTDDSDGPEIPKNVDADARNDDEIYLTWDASDNADSYDIYRSTSSSGTYTKIETVDDDEEFTDSGLSANKTYYYKIKAVDDEGNTSSYSSIVSAKTEDD